MDIHSYSILNLYHLNFWLFYILLSYYSWLNHLVLGLNWIMGCFSTMLLSASWSVPPPFLLTCRVFLFSLYISTYIFTSFSSDCFFFFFFLLGHFYLNNLLKFIIFFTFGSRIWIYFIYFILYALTYNCLLFYSKFIFCGISIR